MAHYYMAGEGDPMASQALSQIHCRSNFDQHRATLVTSEEEGGWRAELQRYLKDHPKNVTRSTDIVKWWQVSHEHISHLLLRTT